MPRERSKMDEYDKKFADMQKYIPFLEVMINRLRGVKDNSREVQLRKMKQLHGILTSSGRKLKIETLEKCEDVLQNLQSKVEKGTSGLNLSSSKKIDNKDTTDKEVKNKTAENDSVKNQRNNDNSTRVRRRKMYEGPASPSPPASPEEYHQSKSKTPIVIPTESKHDYSQNNAKNYSSDKDKPASPDESESVPTKDPIIIPTERSDNRSCNNLDKENPTNTYYNDWNSSSSSLSSRPRDDSRSQSRHLSTAPVASNLRRLPSEIHRSNSLDNDTKNDNNKNQKNSSPESRMQRSRDNFLSPTRNNSKPPTPLLVSPPRVPVEPPLSIEDLTELLNDGSTTEMEDPSMLSSDSRCRLSRNTKNPIDSQRQDKYNEQKSSSSSSTKFVLTQHDIERESERRWEEVDKHIVKFRKGPPSGRSDSKPLLPSPVGADRVLSPGYGNFERHNNPEPSLDINVINSAFSKLSDGDIANLVQTNLQIQTEGFPSVVDDSDNRHCHSSGPTDMYSPRAEQDFHRNHNRQQMAAPPPLPPPPIHHQADRDYSLWNTNPSSQNIIPSLYDQNLPMQQRPPFASDRGWNVPHSSPPIAPQNIPINSGIPSHYMTNQFNHIPNRNQMNPQDMNMPHVQPQYPEEHSIPSLMSNIPSYNIPPYRSHWDNPINRPIDTIYNNGPRQRAPVEPPRGPPSLWGRQPIDDRFSAEHSGFNRRHDMQNRGKSQSSDPRFGGETRTMSENNRDPRFRHDRSPSKPSPNIPIITSSRKDLRTMSTDNSTQKSKEISSAGINRDPRRRSTDSKESIRPTNVGHNLKTSIQSSSLELQKNSDENKSNNDKETMLSPLESLYGAIDTSSKTGKGYGLQTFKIPKLKNKRPEMTPRPPTPPKPSAPRSPVPSPPPLVISDSEKNTEQLSVSNINTELDNKKSDSDKEIKNDEKKMEVSSTTDITQSCIEKDNQLTELDSTTKLTSVELTDDKDKISKDNSEAVVDTSSNNSSSTDEKNKDIKVKESEKAKTKGADQEWIETLIRMSLEDGEGKNNENKKELLEKLRTLNSEKFKKIQKLLLLDDNENNGSDDDDDDEPKKPLIKKKKRIIESDSSDDECLADRLDDVETNVKTKDSDKLNETNRQVTKAKGKIRKKRKRKGKKKSIEKIEIEEEKSEIEAEEKDDNEKIKIEEIEEQKIEQVTKVNEQEEIKESVKDDPVEPVISVLPVRKPRKPAKKRRNSLEMLQEDIREMFICEGVVSATGSRSCTKLNDNSNSRLNDNVDSPDDPKNDNISDNDNDDNEALPRTRRSKSKINNNINKSKTKVNNKLNNNKKNNKKSVEISKKYVTSSSESDNEKPKESEEQVESKKGILKIDSDADKPDEEDNNKLTLRRSGRFKETKKIINENKIDQDTMFDSFSDDSSFCLDISGMAGTVDISLHSDDKIVKKSTDKKSTKINKKKVQNIISNDNVVIENSSKLDDEISVTSDISIADSNASSIKCNNKKNISSTMSIDKNEEIIENVLDDLTVKKMYDSDGEGDIDIDGDDDFTAPKNIKKPLAKKKRKRNSWKMGIVTKKKKKITTVLPSTTATTTTTTTDLPLENENNKSQEQDLNTSDKSIDEAIENVVNNCDDKALNNLTDIKDKLDVTDKKIDNIKIDFDLNTLRDHAYINQEKFTCLLCNFNGKNIVQHYKNVHTNNEVMISRLSILDSKRAVNEFIDDTFIKLSEKLNKESIRKFTCRFCAWTIEDNKDIAIELFYDHCSSHTGEFRFSCTACSYQTSQRKAMRSHFYKVCKKKVGNYNESHREELLPNAVSDDVHGYLCSSCNFLQLKESNISKHIEIYHQSCSNAEIQKISMSGYFGTNELDRDDNSDPEMRTIDESDFGSPVTPCKLKKDNDDNNTKISDDNVTPVKTPDVKIREKFPVKLLLNSTDDCDNSTAKKINAFVCPPELENKEDEITIERKKKMQEILNGSKIQKEKTTENGLSIIDTLKNKMTTHQPESPLPSASIIGEDDDHNDDNDDHNENHNEDEQIDESFTLRYSHSEAEQTINDSENDKPVKSTAESLACDVHSDIQQSKIQTIKKENIDSDDVVQQHDSDKKILKDPLTLFDDKTNKNINNSNDNETSDNNNDDNDDEDDMPELRTYESDTSDDVSDSELPTDVNSLLKNNVNNLSSNPMMNSTIQRLAAQLEAAKNTSMTDDINNLNENKKSTINELIEQNNSNDNTQTSTASTSSSSNNNSDDNNTKDEKTNIPKNNFLRLRRLSGDKLSCGNENETTLNEQKTNDNNVDEEKNNINNNNSNNNDNNDDDNSCSFLRIENVMSLAPNTTNNEESPLVDDIRKAVGTSPMKIMNTSGISILKKPSPNILKRSRTEKLDNIITSLTQIPTGKIVLQSINKTTGNPPPKPIRLLSSKRIQKLLSTPSSSSTGTTTTTLSKTNVPQAIPIISCQISPITAVETTTETTTTTTSASSSSPLSHQQILSMLPGNQLLVPATSQNLTTKSIKNKIPIFSNSHHNNNINKGVKILKVIGPFQKMPDNNLLNNCLAPKEKTSDAYTAMLQLPKLRQLYKCMSIACSFTTDDMHEFSNHFQTHANTYVNLNGQLPPFDYQKCAYCSESMFHLDDMQSHLINRHACCAYQCSYCFYRAASHSYVEYHQLSVHTDKPISVLKGEKTMEIDDTYNKNDFIKPYSCSHNCDKSFYVTEAFVVHLKKNHGSTTIFNCHICPSPSLSIQQLINHYKIHQYHRFHCLYCEHGADKKEDLHKHLSLLHYYRPAKIIERNIPKPCTRFIDIVQQLIVHDLDDNYQKLEQKNDTITYQRSKRSLLQVNSPTLKRTQPAFILPSPIQATSQKAEVINLYDSDGNSETIIPANIINQKNNQDIDNLNTFNDHAKISRILCMTDDKINNVIQRNSCTDPTQATVIPTNQFINNNSNTSSLIVQQFNNIEVTDLSSLPIDHLNCSDEFININVLDNPELLNSIDKSNPPVTMNYQNNNDDNNVDNDSDIEILECIEPVGKNTLRPSVIKTNIKTSSPINTIIDDIKTNVTNITNDYSLDNDSCSNDISDGPIDVKDPSIINDNIDSSNGLQPPQPPRTLDDIKHTGFSGCQLYKCGFENCTFSAMTGDLLREHLKKCNFVTGPRIPVCYHCKKKFSKLSVLIDHLKMHGLKRFGCSLCTSRYSSHKQAIGHLKLKHKFAHGKMIPADPTNPSVDGLYNAYPATYKEVVNFKKSKKGNKQNNKIPVGEKISFSPAEIDLLPRQAIYNREVQCAVCRYSSKVRTNIIRHLQFHANDRTVPESGPVNPVPCLDKKEKMFDKMVNLASSSHQNGRMSTGGPKIQAKDNNITESDIEAVPKYIPDKNRYICSIEQCNFLTLDSSRLRDHMKALHSNEAYYKCPHCLSSLPDQEPLNIPIDKLGIHLKMHESKLYKCSHCNYHHYHRYVVERHLGDKHTDVPSYVKVIREPNENIENSQQSVSGSSGTGTAGTGGGDEAEEGTSDNDNYCWKCNMCIYKCNNKVDMTTHALNEHNEKGQFKCQNCQFKTSGKYLIEQHLLSKQHVNEQVDYTTVYEKVKKIKNTSSEQNTNNETFDTTPLWLRGMPRVRHIRGILFEDDNDTRKSQQKGVTTSGTASTIGTITTTTTSTTPSTPSSSSSFVTSSPIKSGKRKNENDITTRPAKLKIKTTSFEGWTSPEKGNKKDTSMKYLTKTCGTENDDAGPYGPYGQPTGNKFTCTICDNPITESSEEFTSHLFRELNYWRYKCKQCDYLASSRKRLVEHCHDKHKIMTETITLDHKPDIEEWVNNCIKKQQEIMQREKIKPTPIIAKNNTKIINLSEQISNIGASTINNYYSDGDDDDDDDNALIIDSKDDDFTIEQKNNNKSQENESLKNDPIIHDSWFKNYQFLPQMNNDKLSNKRKADELNKSDDAVVVNNNNNKKNNTTIKKPANTICEICSYKALSANGLRTHMRVHANRHTLKCSQCCYTASLETDIWQHIEINHPELEIWKAIKINQPSTSTNEPQHIIKKRRLNDYNDDADIVEEIIPKKPAPTSASGDRNVLYTCYYCNDVNALSITLVESHWLKYHKNYDYSSKYLTGVPFKYKEMAATVMTKQSSNNNAKLMQCGYCNKKGSLTSLRPHSSKKHPGKVFKAIEPNDVSHDIFVCGWCGDKVMGSQRTEHHNIFHSHLHQNFRKEINKNIKQRGYACPECTFISATQTRMKKHVTKHCDVFKCKKCNCCFTTHNLATQHSLSQHPGILVSSIIQPIVLDVNLLISRIKRTVLIIND
ncbi:uncharacterized protein LOC122848343 isoform X1 [Aphidius gifuensis]|uniref:uncharacterized protein LOC122848343 isoform X1 n=2 Tax=Aphidius gifuensis TaxID=684658 RepID=UPI001CDC949F|nr:uncharacterized protein LOC122848343 isoform X1 [Aphidius gifuensis]XP_044002276.1 uncharacterized protein LOC122848343 isoform X1 [Aphidius gifuensis]XP_044002277.1 uncharacterized protein LOC122848343 isoform X1 [Aphidius gifuensis]